jgi:hypothetical protein
MLEVKFYALTLKGANGFSAALAAVGPTGHVTATDVAWAICKKNLALLYPFGRFELSPNIRRH